MNSSCVPLFLHGPSPLKILTKRKQSQPGLEKSPSQKTKFKKKKKAKEPLKILSM